ncbi:probable glutathione S-transferase [Trifolium pratense]|uniref:probable glutathione S-transferase n=1 Tax=Trifolium pratense TaxID=57577 RepID=UPI001E691902|nr:probable glutathione S-transferase [Trifolium pratense]
MNRATYIRQRRAAGLPDEGGSSSMQFPGNLPQREKAIEELYEALQFLENELKDKFFGGDKIGFVDIAALFIPLFQEVAEKQLFTSDTFHKLHKWSQDFYNHPVVKETMPSKEQQFAYFKARAASLAAPSK